MADYKTICEKTLRTMAVTESILEEIINMLRSLRRDYGKMLMDADCAPVPSPERDESPQM